MNKYYIKETKIDYILIKKSAKLGKGSPSIRYPEFPVESGCLKF